MKRILLISAFLPSLMCASGCDDAGSKGKEKPDQVVAAWKGADFGPVKLELSKDGLAGGTCQVGKVAGLHVSLCEYADALAADSAKAEGLGTIASNTGTALVRDRYLLVVADVDKVDVHGKVLNQVAKLFLTPPIPGAAKLP